MQERLKKLLRCGRYVFRCVILYLPARLLRRVHPAYRVLWLVGERGIDARDNGYWLFHYLRTAQPQCNARYVIAADSADREKAAALGKTVDFGSLRHYLMYLAADVLAGTHVQPAAPEPWTAFRLTQRGFRAPGRQIFLQHGITKDDISYLHAPGLHLDLFVSGAKPEYDFLAARFGHPDGVVRYLGFCRFDNLAENVRHEREILLMPTWRGSSYPDGEAFLQTPYYRAFQELLDAPELAALLERLDFRLIFYPHIELQKELRHFHASSERIVLADSAHYDVQELLLRCSLLVTDYSSVFFDVAYMDKPVVYYQFDQEEYRGRLYREGYFSYEENGFGPVVKTRDALLAALVEAAENGFALTEEYRERIAGFFPLHDRNNCERTYRAILALDEAAGAEREQEGQ